MKWQFNREIEITRNKQILKLENTMNEMKNKEKSISIRLDQAEKRKCEVKGTLFESTQSEENKERMTEKSEENCINYCIA